MSTEEEKWMEEVFDSMKGSQRAQPGPELFGKIKKQLDGADEKIIPLRQWRYAAAVAAIVLLANVATLFTYQRHNDMPGEGFVMTDNYSQSLISSYQIYE